MRFPTIESALALWVEHAIHHEQALTGEILKVKAQEFADKMNINELVNRFPIDREEVRMEASEFVNSEDFISVQDMPTTESIIATIEGEDLSESEDSPIVKSISHKSALEHVNSLLLYITQDCDSELQVDTAFLSNLKKLKRTIETKQQNMLQQTSILAFYHCCMSDRNLCQIEIYVHSEQTYVRSEFMSIPNRHMSDQNLCPFRTDICQIRILKTTR